MNSPVVVAVTALAIAAGACLAATGADAKYRRYYSPKRTHWSPARTPNATVPTPAAISGDRHLDVAIKVMPDPDPKSSAAVAAASAKRPLKMLKRAEILGSDPERLERLGRHVMVGYLTLSEVKQLVERRAIAGVFITDKNVRRRKASDVAAEIKSLQDIRRSQGLPALIVASDQEGGYVSKLSPPLKWQPSLGTLVAPLKSDAEREKAVRRYAEAQARDLKSLGITMNFGPVVDLRLNPNRNDGETRLFWRAIDSDPFLVAKVAGWYCDTLTKFNIICTLKHFPGLGRVARDTHVRSGDIAASATQLELSDWVPFRRLVKEPGVAMMIGHVKVNAIDSTTPASYSEPVINSLVRSRMGDDGLIVTDDFSMGGVTNGPDGLGGAAIKSLNAGTDIILVSFQEKHFDTLMSSLIEADERGEIDTKRQALSQERIKKYLVFESTAGPVQAEQLPTPPSQKQ